MNIAKIEPFDIANGPGVRMSIFVSGCTHACPGCFNTAAQDPNYGDKFTKEMLDQIVNTLYLNAQEIRGISILGGEPLQQDVDELYYLIATIKDLTSDLLPVWLWTGYSFETNKDVFKKYRKVIELCDTIIDGRYVEELKDYNLQYRGSANQNILNVKGLNWDE